MILIIFYLKKNPIGLIDNLCHEVIYHKHDNTNYDLMTDLVVNNIKNLFKDNLN